MKLRKLNNGYYSLYDSDGDIVASNNPNTPCSKKLSKQNCDEMFGVIDIQQQINKKLNDYHVFREAVAYYNKDKYAGKKVEDAFIKGAEYIVKILLSEQSKLFTVEDMQKAIYIAWEDDNLSSTDIIQLLQPPTEIEVEIVMRCSLPNGCTEPKIECTCEPTYNLDENGCLTLWVLSI